MKNLLIYVVIVVFIFNFSLPEALASEKELLLSKSQLIIADKYAEKFCNAKEDNFFKGLDNERTLKYSYFKYMGFQNREINSRDMYNTLIQQIKERCHLNKDEEREINEFFMEESIP